MVFNIDSRGNFPFICIHGVSLQILHGPNTVSFVSSILDPPVFLLPPLPLLFLFGTFIPHLHISHPHMPCDDPFPPTTAFNDQAT